MSDKNANFEPRVRLLQDGSIANPKHEWLAMLVAEGLRESEAWKMLLQKEGKAVSDASRKYGKRVFANKVWIQRKETLVIEKTELEKDPLWGTALWQCAELYRAAVADMDPKLMAEAIKLRISIIEKMAPKAEPAEAKPTDKGPGRAAAEAPQTKGLPPAAIRAKLMQVGRSDEELDAQSEVAGEA